MRVLVTGGCGFLGSHFVRAWLSSHDKDTITNIDCLTYAGSLDNLEDAANNSRQAHVPGDIAEAASFSNAWTSPFDLVVHFAAETHVDRSLENASRFVRTNVLGTEILLRMAKERGCGTFIVISSDEVYGPTPKGALFGTGDPLRPTSPYAASKASSDWMALAYARSFGLDITIIRSVNVFGPRQYPEKLIPLFAINALSGLPLPLYGHGRQRRSWIYIDDFIGGLTAVISEPDKRRERPVWHLGSVDELENRRIAESICRLCDADPSLITHVPDRPGHDQRYALDFSQTSRVFGWKPIVQFDDGLSRTIDWIKTHTDWHRRRLGWIPQFLRDTK